jgi:membrane protein
MRADLNFLEACRLIRRHILGPIRMALPDDPPPRWLTGLLLLGAIAMAWRFEGQRTPVLARADAPGGDGNAIPSQVKRDAVRTASAFRMPWARWKQVLINTYNEIGNDRLLAVAAGVVFYALLAIFPTITAFVSLYGLFSDASTINNHLSLLSNMMPAGGVEIIREQVLRIVSKNDGRLGFAFVGGLALALWSANAGVKAMIDALNVIEGNNETRGFVKLNAISLTFTLGAILFLMLSVAAVVAFPVIMSMFGLNSLADSATWLIRWPVLLVIVMGALSVLYRFGPNSSNRRWRFISPGIIAGAVIWIAGSAALSFYLSYFADYNATYGSLGAAIGLMMWMWLSAIAVLAGAELDSEIDKCMPGHATPEKR